MSKFIEDEHNDFIKVATITYARCAHRVTMTVWPGFRYCVECGYSLPVARIVPANESTWKVGEHDA